MSQVSDKDVDAIREWLNKEPTLPKNFDTILLKKFIYSCHRSLERTKRCIESFCTNRSIMSEIFINRDPESTRLKTAFDITNVANYIGGEDEILVHRIKNVEKFEFYDCLKTLMLQADYWMKMELEVLPKNQIIILDIKEYTLKLVAKVNVLYFQKFLIFLLESMPLRLKHVHVINCPSYTEYMYGLVKGVLPKEIQNIIHFHTDHMGLHDFIDKKHLPIEYSGETWSMVQQSSKIVTEIVQNRKFYLDDHLWKADISKKVKNAGAVDTTMSGSFRTLAID